MMRTISGLLAAAALCAAQPPLLKVACRIDARTAPLIAAATFGKDFNSRYGLRLELVKAGETYNLLDGRHPVLSLRLLPFNSDSAVLRELLDNDAQVGILGAEAVLQAVVAGEPAKVIAPLQHRGDMLVVGTTLAAVDWPGFLKWVRELAGATRIGYVGRNSMTVLGFEQALDYEKIAHCRDTTGTAAKVVLLGYDSWQALAIDLGLGRVDATIMAEPEASRTAASGGNRIIERIDILPPGRFEDRPNLVIASTVQAIAERGADIGAFLELMAVATHYANNRTRNTLSATAGWLKAPVAVESAAIAHVRFSSLPDVVFGDGLWNWYFALKLRKELPDSLSGFMEKKDWLGLPCDSLLIGAALDRAGARIVR